MTHKLLVVTFEDDLLQFTMFCHCLEKNWKGQRALLVVMGKDTNRVRVEQIVAQTLTDWEVEIYPTIIDHIDGSIEQQINKIYYSTVCQTHDVIVFDSKDFLLRPCGFDTFKQNNLYRVTYKIQNKKLIEMGYDIGQVVDQSVERLPAVSNLTPWIWNRAQLESYWNHLNTKFGDYRTWLDFPAGNEIYGYYVYVWTNPKQPIRFLSHAISPLLVSGGWTHQTYKGMLEQANEFDQDADRIIWKHSRKLQDPRCLDVTRSVLIRYGIDPAFVDSVYGPSDLVPT